MNHILLLKDKEGASSDEFFQIMKRYSEKNECECTILHAKATRHSDLHKADIVFCIRGDTPYMKYLVYKAKMLGKIIVYFLDDALKDIPDNTFRYPKRKKWHIECVRLCDVLLTTNPLIANDYKNYIRNQRTAIIHTAVNEIQPTNICNNKRIKIVYAASEWHIPNYNRMISPIINELLNNNKSSIEIYFVGLRPSGIEQDKVHFIPKMKLEDYQKFMKNSNFDIGLAPLEDSYFSGRKYFNKFIEYTRYGICGVYSDVYPYRFVVKNKENGIMVRNEPQEWLRCIQSVIDNEQLRKSCVLNAQKYLKEHHSDEVIFSKLISDIPEIGMSSANKKINIKIAQFKLQITKLFRFYPFFIKEKIYMLYYSVKKEGLKTALKRMIRKFL